MTANTTPTDTMPTDTMPTPMTMPVEVWSDVVCPWCCIGRAHLKQALGEFEHGDAVEVTWRSFELDPGAPAQATEPLAEQLGRKYGGTPADIQAMFAGVTARAAAVGLDFRFDSAQPGNTVDAHRLLHLARESGQQDQLKERFFTAYFTEGEAIGDPDTLARLAKQAGLDPDRGRRGARDRSLPRRGAGGRGRGPGAAGVGSAVLRDRPEVRGGRSPADGGAGRGAAAGLGGARSVVAP